MWALDSENIEKRVTRIPTLFEVTAFIFLLLTAFFVSQSDTIYAQDFYSYLVAARGEQFHLAYYYPYYLLPIFDVFDLLSYQSAYILWSAINILGMLLAVRIFGGHSMLSVFNFLAVIAIAEGQITGILFAAVAVMWWAIQRRWIYIASIASLFVMIKYSYGGVIALTLLLHPNFTWKQRCQLLIIPASTVAISLIIWGLWPLEQLDTFNTNPPVATGSVALWQTIGPLALLFWLPVVFMKWSPQKRFLLVLVTISLGLPYLLRQDVQLMFLPMYYYSALSNLLIVFILLFGDYAARAFVLVPLSIYAYMVIRGLRDESYLTSKPGAYDSGKKQNDGDIEAKADTLEP